MPESPEVDALAGYLRARLAGRRITGVEVVEFRAVKTPRHPLDELIGRALTGVQRFGKHLVLDAEGPSSLAVSLGRAGWAQWTGPGDGAEDSAPVMARLAFGDDGLAVTDAGTWLSLGLWVVAAPTDVPAIAKLGPDPLDPTFTRADFDRILDRRKQLKALLQEQDSLAGIGNAYSDEILHVARLSPTAHAVTLGPDERARLYDAVRGVLADAVAARRDVPPEGQKAAKVAAMRVHGRAGESCPVCGATILDVPGTKGGAQYCAQCQTSGVPLDQGRDG